MKKTVSFRFFWTHFICFIDYLWIISEQEEETFLLPELVLCQMNFLMSGFCFLLLRFASIVSLSPCLVFLLFRGMKRAVSRRPPGRKVCKPPAAICLSLPLPFSRFITHSFCLRLLHCPVSISSFCQKKKSFILHLG